MFRIYADGQLLYEPNQRSDGLVIGPTCDAEAGLSGQLSFTMLPGHYLYDTIKKLKTEIVATLDGEEIFRGRILNWDIDFYKNKKVHCEGDISYLLDSMQPPHDLKLTPTAYLTWMISEHNIQVDAPKRFTIGQITIDAALTEHDFIDASFRDTRESIDSDLINVFGGFLRTRRVGAVTYLDYLKEYTETGEQALEFGSNLIDLTQSLSSDEIFTILLPTGEPVPPVMEGAPSWPLTIESVNNGSKLLENVDAVAQFGRIVRNQFFEKITDAAELKAAGEEFLEKAYKAPFNSYTIQGLDLHLLDATIQQFKIGLLCRIRSAPHGIDVTLPIVRIAWGFDNPDATEIVIAPLVREPSLKLTSNSGGISSTIGQVAGGKSGGKMNQLYKYYTEGENWAKIQADKINLISGDMASQGAQIEINKNAIDIRVKKDEVINAINVSTEGIKLAGSKVQVTGANGIRLSAGLMYDKDLKEILDDSYSRIDLAEDAIDLRVKKDDDIAALINLNASGTLIYGKQVSLLGQNGFKFTAGGSLEEDPVTGDLKEVLDNAYSQIYASKEEINLKVSKDGVITAINIAPGVVTIDAAKLNITGIVTAGGLALQGDLSATNALISNLRAGVASFSHVVSSGGASVAGALSGGWITSPEITGTNIYGGTIHQGGTALNDLFLGKTSKAADSNRLNGELASFYALKSVTDGHATAITNNANAIVAHGTLIDGKSNIGHGHAIGAISGLSRTSASFVTEVTRSTTRDVFMKTLSTTGYALTGVSLEVTKNTYYFYT